MTLQGTPVLVVGAGIMGAGIAQVAAQAGHAVLLFDAREGAAVSLEAMHQLKAEAVQMKENLLQGDLAGFARTLQQGWQAQQGEDQQ